MIQLNNIEVSLMVDRADKDRILEYYERTDARIEYEPLFAGSQKYCMSIKFEIIDDLLDFKTKFINSK